MFSKGMRSISATALVLCAVLCMEKPSFAFCDPCKKELPALNSLVDELNQKNIKVIIIGYKEGFEKFIGMLEGLKFEKPVILSDPYGKAGKEYGVYGLPMTVFIGADGIAKVIVKGELTGKAIKEKAAKFFK